MSQSLVTIVSSAARPHIWQAWYEGIKDTNISFEVIFVGPSRPNYQLPDNFSFIETQVKPVQCWEIATRNVDSKYIVFLPDDLIFMKVNSLTSLIEEFKNYSTDKLMLSCRYLEGNHLWETSLHQVPYHPDIYMPVGFIVDSAYYRYLGGLDINFTALYWDLDLCFRIVADGGITRLSNVVVTDLGAHANSLWGQYQRIDQAEILARIWPISLGSPIKRTVSLEPFTDYKILEESQGPKGRWI